MDDKFFRVPALKGVDDVLEVLTHQEKYIAQMQAMAALRDTIQEKLGLLTTKEDADRFLSAAVQKMEDAVGCSEVVEAQQREVVAARAASKSEREALEADKAEWGVILAESNARLGSERNALIADVAACREELQLGEQALQAQQGKLTQQRQQLEIEQAAWRQKLEQLSVVMRVEK